MDKTEFQARASALAGEASGEVSVLCRELDGSEPAVSINADALMVSASVIKLPILFYALGQVQLRAARLEELIDVREPAILDDSVCFETGPRHASLLELLTWMTISSDNTSSNVLIDLFGYDAINRFCASIGLSQTRLERKMLDFQAITEGRNNYTSANDIYTLFRAFFGGELLGEELAATALDILLGQRDKGRLARYIWERDIVIAHKTGGLDYLSHDAGVLMYGGRRLYAGVFVQKAVSIDGDPRLIGGIGRLAAQYIQGL